MGRVWLHHAPHLRLLSSQLFLPAHLPPEIHCVPCLRTLGFSVASQGWRRQILDFSVAVCAFPPHLAHQTPPWSQGPASHLLGQALSSTCQTVSWGFLPGRGGVVP